MEHGGVDLCGQPLSPRPEPQLDCRQIVDYYFIYGPEMDRILHEYRFMTGHTPLAAEMGLRIVPVERSLRFPR